LRRRRVRRDVFRVRLADDHGGRGNLIRNAAMGAGGRRETQSDQEHKGDKLKPSPQENPNPCQSHLTTVFVYRAFLKEVYLSRAEFNTLCCCAATLHSNEAWSA
jgi:hypothetical protein